MTTIATFVGESGESMADAAARAQAKANEFLATQTDVIVSGVHPATSTTPSDPLNRAAPFEFILTIVYEQSRAATYVEHASGIKGSYKGEYPHVNAAPAIVRGTDERPLRPLAAFTCDCLYFNGDSPTCPVHPFRGSR